MKNSTSYLIFFIFFLRTHAATPLSAPPAPINRENTFYIGNLSLILKRKSDVERM